ncbi:hypothetical protein MLD38_005316 [Melastoma candidum]|uniref:Uncharacterized protein n=1 Tax=Melastoma candidum TaxID=119954 RepID=A0ACB9SA17_9MYRT|nr:hypothetical protein MLD38_040850 [Melastoma candidum]KAI4387488.1 hypothetical protein MLD38_005316 [Melastoma candidum]
MLAFPYPKMSYATLHEATGGFSSKCLIGDGSFGLVYKGTLHDKGETVAMKVLKTQERTSKNFLAECEAMRHIRHWNLVKDITICSSIDRAGNEFKALVFQYMPNGSLENWLHPSSQQPGMLNWKQRIGILTDVASAIHYMRHLCHTPSL